MLPVLEGVVSSSRGCCQYWRPVLDGVVVVGLPQLACQLHQLALPLHNLQVMHNASPITCINYWQSCAEGV